MTDHVGIEMEWSFESAHCLLRTVFSSGKSILQVVIYFYTCTTSEVLDLSTRPRRLDAP